VRKKKVQIDNGELESLVRKLHFLEGSNKALVALQEKIENLATFHSEMILSHDISHLLATGLNKLRELVEAETCSLFLVDEEKAEFVHHASIPRRLSSLSKSEVRAQIASGTFGWAVSNDTPVCVPTLVFGKRENRPKCAIIAPLHTKERTIGALIVVFEEDEAFIRQGVLKLLNILADFFALSLANAQLFKDLNDSHLHTIMTLVNAIEAKDRYTRGHSVRVGELALQAGTELRLHEEALDLLRTSALLHDVGKIGVSEFILLKKGLLTGNEHDQIKQHPAIGAAIIQPMKGFEKVAAVVYHHHERYDGYGYPDGLKGKDIPLAARILAVCDTFAAMTSDRPHRKALSLDRAIAELKSAAGTQLDPAIVEALLRVIKKKEIRPEKLRVGV